MLLSACLIVKNEERFLPGCLRSIAVVCDELVVVDTGSTDRTVAIAREFDAVVRTFAWTGDFAAARNESLAHARGEFVLSIDADEELHSDDAAPLRDALASGACDVVAMRIVSQLAGGAGSNVGRYPRVFRRYPDARFTYAIHEQIWPSLAPHAPRVLDSELRIVHHGYDQDEAVLQQKRVRNLEACRRVVAREPENAFFLFHVGLGHLQLAEPMAALPWLAQAHEHASTERERANVLAAMGQALVDAGQPAEAIEPLRRSVELAPSQTWAWSSLGEALLAVGRHAEAGDALARCLGVAHSSLHTDVSPPAPTLWMKLGLARLLVGRVAEAADALEQGVRLGLAPELVAQVVAVGERYLASAGRGE